MKIIRKKPPNSEQPKQPIEILGEMFEKVLSSKEYQGAMKKGLIKKVSQEIVVLRAVEKK